MSLILLKRNLRVAFLKVDRQDDSKRDDSGHKDVDDNVLLESAKCTVHKLVNAQFVSDFSDYGS